MSKKTALEQAIFEADEMVKQSLANAKEMLYSQFKPELEKTIKESLENDDDTDDEIDSPEDSITDTLDDSGEENTSSDLNPTDTDDTEDTEEVLPVSVVGGDDSLDTDDSSVAIDDLGDDDSELDLTGADDDQVIQVFKKLADTAEIEVVKTDDNHISVKKDGEEYIVKLNENFEEDFGNTYEDDKYSFIDSLGGEESGSSDDDIIFEIVMDEEEDTLPPAPEGNPLDNVVLEEEPIEEVARTHADGRKQERKPKGFYEYASSRVRPAERSSMNESDAKIVVINEQLKSQNTKLINEKEELGRELNAHKVALRKLRENIETAALFNINLAHVNKLFCEHVTTKDEKKSIIERFDVVETVKESKALYKTIGSEMKGKTIVSESIDEKINKTVSGTGAPLLESVQKTDASEKIDRMKKLMEYSNKNR